MVSIELQSHSGWKKNTEITRPNHRPSCPTQYTHGQYIGLKLELHISTQCSVWPRMALPPEMGAQLSSIEVLPQPAGTLDNSQSACAPWVPTAPQASQGWALHSHQCGFVLPSTGASVRASAAFPATSVDVIRLDRGMSM